METLRQSYIYAFAMRFAAWIGRQWEGSYLITWLTSQKQDSRDCSIFARLAASLRQVYCGICDKLKLGQLLDGSIFLHPMLFIGAAVALAPLCPTIVILGLVCAGFFSVLLRMGTNREFGITPSPLNKYVLLYAFAYLYATLGSVTLAGSLFPGMLTIAFMLFFFGISSCGLETRRLRQLMWIILAVGVMVSAYGFYQFLFPEQFTNVWTDSDMFSAINFRVYSTLENPNVLGEYFLLVIPLAGAMVLTADTWPKRIACLAATGIMGICLILTYSRGCYLGLLFAAAVFLVLLDSRFIVVGVIAVLLCPLYLPDSVLSRFTSIGNLGDTSTNYRVNIWMGTVAMLKDYWFCGVGPGTEAFNAVYPDYAFNGATAQHPHSLYLQLVCDTGIVGIALFLVLIVSFYRMMFTAIRRETDKQARIFQIAGTSAITGFLVQSATDYTFYNYKVMLLFWAMLGLCVLFARMGHPKDRASSTEVA